MRFLSLLAAISTLILAMACGQSHNSATLDHHLPGGTGAFDPKDGQAYTNNGDLYVEQRLSEQDDHAAAMAVSAATPDPSKGSKSTPTTTPAPNPVPQHNELTDRVKEFEISRFNTGSVGQASRFGSDSFEFKVFFRGESPADFKGKMVKQKDGSFLLQGQAEGFKIVTLPDHHLSDDRDKEKSTAVFKLTDTKTGDSIEISYRAYKATLTVHQDAENPLTPDSDVAHQIQELSEHTYGWVNNWTVINGPAFYLVDFIKIIDPKSGGAVESTPGISFRGENKATAGENEAFTYDAESLTPDLPQVKMVGNNETGAGSAYQLTLQDKQTKKTSDVVVAVTPTDPESTLPAINPEDIPVEYGPAPEDKNASDNTSTPQNPPVPTPNPKNTGTKTPAAPTKKPEPVVAADAFLAPDMNFPRTKRQADDIAKTFKMASVQTMIVDYQKNRANTRTREKMYFLFNNAYPFKSFIQTLSQALDSNPIWMALGLSESTPYFQTYKIEHGDYSKIRGGYQSLGPFQLHDDTARGLGMFAQLSLPANDERRYFAPSACGAARLMVQLTTQFWKNDTVMAILGYNQGGGNAVKFANRWTFNWPETETFRTQISKTLLDYVNDKLAIYFIANNRHKFGFDSNRGETTSLPQNAAPTKFRDSQCQTWWNQSQPGS